MTRHISGDELAALKRLRDGFLSKSGAQGDYWESADELALYDGTFGERIGWKWDAVLQELAVRGWAPQSKRVIDWGCGSGIAGRRVAAAWPGQFESLTLHDRSRSAITFATARARQMFPDLPIDSSLPNPLPPGTLLVLSHVINELPASTLDRLLAWAQPAEEILWVEAGAFEESRRLVSDVRERLLGEGGFSVVAPCTHGQPCGLAAAKNAPHWCHSFGRPPSIASRSGRWAEFSRELGIDLRALPYSFLVLSKRAAAPAGGDSRVIGRPLDYKGYSKVLSCHAEGVGELTLQKRDAPELLRQVREDVCPPVYRWKREGERIVGLEG
jgi:hypothetical protein